MLKIGLIAAALVAGSFATPSTAVEFMGGNIEYRNVSDFDGGAFRYSQNSISGSIVLGFGADVGVQIDAGLLGYDGGLDSATSLGGHAFYRFSDRLVAGAYYSNANWTGDTWQSYGIEALFTPDFMNGKLAFEASAGLYGETDIATIITFRANYEVSDEIEVSAGYLIGYWYEFGNPADQYDMLSLAATYSMDSGMYATASFNGFVYPFADGDVNFGLSIGYNFGDGPLFGQRTYAGFYPGD